mgnify:FL=1
MKKTLNDIKELIEQADCILIGAGAGLSTSAGIDYAGDEFKKEFAPFIKKYGFTDLYTASFYEFETEEEKWAYFAKHIKFADTGRKATPLYKNIYELVKNKSYFVITTNVDDQFEKAGFEKNKIFATQGSYSKLQCSEACHNKLYDDTELVNRMIEETDCNLKIPTNLVPICPVCKERMEVNLRKDAYFVQDENWYKQSKAYEDFVNNAKDKKVILLELGVGFNTPIIIRFPFEQMTMQNKNWNLIRINKDNVMTWNDIEEKSILIQEDIANIINKL